MSSFAFEASATRVVFGSGSLESLAAEIDRLGRERVLLVSTPGRTGLAESATTILGQRFAAKFARAEVHVPEGVAADARRMASESHADCIVALGGGSAIGVAKAVAVELPIPIVAVPTTYGGSEMTPIWGLTRNGRKETGRNARAQPRVVIYDPDLTLTLSPRTTASSGLNALAHCIEALYAADANPLTSSASLAGIRLIARSLPVLARLPTDAANRASALQGAWLAGFALGTVQMALHHKLCHTLGGSFDLPHAETHAALLPYAAAFNRRAAPSAMSMAAEALGGHDAPTAIRELATGIGAPLSLEEIGFREADIASAAALACEKQYPNPRPVTIETIHELLTAAFHGDAAYLQGL